MWQRLRLPSKVSNLQLDNCSVSNHTQVSPLSPPPAHKHDPLGQLELQRNWMVGTWRVREAEQPTISLINLERFFTRWMRCDLEKKVLNWFATIYAWLTSRRDRVPLQRNWAPWRPRDTERPSTNHLTTSGNFYFRWSNTSLWTMIRQQRPSTFSRLLTYPTSEVDDYLHTT